MTKDLWIVNARILNGTALFSHSPGAAALDMPFKLGEFDSLVRSLIEEGLRKYCPRIDIPFFGIWEDDGARLTKYSVPLGKEDRTITSVFMGGPQEKAGTIADFVEGESRNIIDPVTAVVQFGICDGDQIEILKKAYKILEQLYEIHRVDAYHI